MSIIAFLKLFFVIVATLFGIVIGSFLNVVIYRVPEGRTISKGHSMCMSCGHTLGALDLVPIFSWLLLGGKCRYCKAPVASRYIKIESFTGLVFLLISFTYRTAGLFPLYNSPYNRVFYWIILCMCLLLLTFTFMISQMMIYHDKQKCFVRFPVLSFISITSFALLSGYTFDIFQRMVSYLIVFVACCVLMSLIIGGVAKIKELDYGVNELLFDFSNLFFIFSVALRYISIFDVTLSVFFFLVAIIYISIRLYSFKNIKLKRFIGIINMSIVVILLVLGYIYFLNN